MQISEIHFNPKTIFAFHLRKLKLHLSFYNFRNCNRRKYFIILISSNFMKVRLFINFCVQFCCCLFLYFIFTWSASGRYNAKLWTRKLCLGVKILITDCDVKKTFDIWSLLSKVSNILMSAVIVVWEKLLCSPASKLKEERNSGWDCSLQYQPASITSSAFLFSLCW